MQPPPEHRPPARAGASVTGRGDRASRCAMTAAGRRLRHQLTVGRRGSVYNAAEPAGLARRFAGVALVRCCAMRAFSAVFICSKPASVFASVPLTNATRDAGEALRLDETASAAIEGLDPEAVLPVEDVGHEQTGRASAPRGSPRRRARWLERRRPRSRRLDSHLEPRTLTRSPLIRRMNGFHSG
jgi:hypothetical protein